MLAAKKAPLTQFLGGVPPTFYDQLPSFPLETLQEGIISQSDLHKLVNYVPNLKNIGFDIGGKFEANDLVVVLKSCPKLEAITTSSVPWDDAALAAIAEHGKNIRSLNLWRAKFTDEGVKLLAKIPNLSVLRVIYCDHVTELSMKFIAENAPHLTELITPSYEAYRLPVKNTGSSSNAVTEKSEDVNTRNQLLRQELEDLLKGIRPEAKSVQGIVTPHVPFVYHPTGEASDANKTTDIFFVFSTDTGIPSAKVLEEHFKQRNINYIAFPTANGEAFNAADIEKAVASSSAIVALLSKFALRQAGLIFALEAAMKYESVRVILTHDAETCFFPGPSEQPEQVQMLFAEKAVTFLSDYADVVTDQIQERLEEQKTTNEKGKHLEEHVHEDLRTKMFLSHRRATAQGIAGRLYEGFHEFYNVFLDSEAQFKIHDLRELVSKTEVFVLILSEGYLESEWCIKELQAAVDFNLKIIVVRDARYEMPEKLATFQNLIDPSILREIVKTRPLYTWLPEYHNKCVRRMRKGVLGVGEKHLQEFLSSYKHLASTKVYDEKNPLVIDNISIPMGELLIGLEHEGVTVSAVRIKTNEESDEDARFRLPKTEEEKNQIFESTEKAFDYLINITYLCISNSADVSDNALEKLSLNSPGIQSLILEGSSNKITNTGFKFLARCRDLKKLVIMKCSQITDEGLNLIAGCTKLTNLKLCNSNISDVGVESVIRLFTALEELHLPISTSITVKGLNVITSTIGPNLRALDISLLKIKSEEYAMVGRCSKLESFICGCCSASAKSFSVIGKGCPNLRNLGLQFARTAGEVLPAIAETMPNLEFLNLENSSISPDDLEVMAENWNIKNLRSVNLMGCHFYNGIPSLFREKCPNASFDM